LTIDQAINLLVTVTLIEMMIAVGLGVSFADLAGVGRDGGLVLRAVLANYLCVPAVTVGLLLLFDAQPQIAIGFLILAVCPGAPYGPPLTAVAKGNKTVAIGLMAILAGSSAIVAPMLLHYLMPVVSGSEPLDFEVGQIVVTLLVTQLVPLSIGLALRQWRPRWADRLQRPANLLAKVLNLAAVGLILAVQFHLFLEIAARGFVGMVVLLAGSWASGWLLAGPLPATRRALTLTTALRNVGVGLVIATGSFADTPAVSAVLIYGLFEVVGSSLLALWWGRQATLGGAPA